MKNKKLLVALLAIVVLAVVAIVVPGLNKPKDNAKLSVGVLQFVTHPALDDIYKGIKDGLADEGYQNVKINFYNGEGDQAKLATMANQLVDQKNTVLVGIATPAAQALANSTEKTPIIMGAVSDPLGAKLVKNAEHPDKNVTGVSDRFPTDKALELILTLTPDIKRVGVLYSSNEDNSKSQVASFTQAAKAKGLEVTDYTVTGTNDVATVAGVALEKVDALYVPLDNTIASAFSTVVDLAQKVKKPVYPSVDTMVAQGGFAAVAQNQHDLGVATGKMAAQVLKGKPVKTLPVTFYDKVIPVINKEVAKDLGIAIPDALQKTAELISTKK